MLSQKYQLEQIELDEEIQKLKAALAESKQSVEDARKWIEIVKQYSEPTELILLPREKISHRYVVFSRIYPYNLSMEKKTMGELIAILRKTKGLTQKDLSEMLNVSDKAVSRWE